MAESSNKKASSIRRLLLTKLQKNRRGFLWVTLGFFLISLAAHWVFAWFAYVQEQIEHNQAIELTGYFNQTLRDTMENWQSEFLQLMWQVAGLSFLLYVGSPQSKESSERIEEKIDLIMKRLQERNLDQEEKRQIAR
ncbi:MAG: hypothetical protein ICV56_06825 [Nitrososphaeraceae archaeon]|nr:hypothetical protein [Nitrososphaeraceae archaeon]